MIKACPHRSIPSNPREFKCNLKKIIMTYAETEKQCNRCEEVI